MSWRAPMPERLKDQYFARFREYYENRLGVREWQDAAMKRLCLEVADAHIRRLRDIINGGTARILDLGSGPGDLGIALGLGGQVVVSVEPSTAWVRLSKAWSDFLGLSVEYLEAVGENIPCVDGSFDLVCASHVLEHVGNPAIVLTEIRRVLADGGFCYVNAPNYLWPFEPHYGLPWLPGLPKRAGAIYLHALGRNSAFVNHLNYTTSIGIKSVSSRLGFTVLRDYMAEYIMDPDNVKDEKWRSIAERLRPVRRWASTLANFAPDVALLLQKRTRPLHRD